MSSYDSHSKTVILIAIVHILCYIWIVLLPAVMMACGTIMETPDAILMNLDEDLDIHYLLLVGYKVLMTILAGLMIRGVIKQRHVLIAPWLIMTSLSWLGMIAIFITNFFIEGHIFMGFSLETIVMEILIIYPTYTLYKKLRPKSIKQDEIVEIKIKSADHILV